MILDVDLETLPREDLEALQLRRLKALVERVYENVPFYRKNFDERGLKPADIQSLADVKLLPFTTKQDLRDNYPFGMFAVSRENIVRIHSSSGTTGKATVVGYTRRDIRNWGRLMGRCLAAAGLTSQDLLHNAYGYGLFTGGLGAHYGAERLGCAVVPISGGQTERQVQLIRDFKATMIVGTPSYVLNIVDEMERLGIDPRSTSLRRGMFGAEPWTEQMRGEMPFDTLKAVAKLVLQELRKGR
jgi:phenylacetate-CoA ligase